MSRKAQLWISDLTIGVIMFTVASIAAFTILLNAFDLGGDYKSMKTDAVKISEYLMSIGTPEDWNQTSLVRPGFVSYNRFNDSKIYFAMNFSNSSYASIKSSMQTQFDFIAVIKNRTGHVVAFQDFCAFGKPLTGVDYSFSPLLVCGQVNFTDVEYSNLVKIVRYGVYNSDIATLEVYLWD